MKLDLWWGYDWIELINHFIPNSVASIKCARNFVSRQKTVTLDYL